MKQVKLEARQRVAQILAAALELAPAVGYQKLTRDAVAARLGVSPSLIPAHMGTMAEFRRALMREAVRVGCLPVIAQGLAARDRHAQKAPPELRARALQSLAS
jgi:AcrR family transcriptional regulator